MGRWESLRRLTGSERWVLVQALLLLPLTGLALRLLGLRRWQAVLGWFTPAGPGAEAGAEGRTAARLVDAAARHGPYRATCLPRSLALWWLLRRRGVAADLRIGVRKEDGQFQAHAWVESCGLVLNDGADVRERFVPFGRAIAPAVMRSS